MELETIPTLRDEDKKAIQAVLDAVASEHTRRAYSRALNDFMTWYRATGQVRLDKATVQSYAAQLAAQGVSASSINQRLSAIRKFAQEAADNSTTPEAQQLAQGVARVKGLHQEGTRMGNWLTLQQAETLINTPDITTLKGLRDRAILAVLIGTGLRRTEAANLTLGHIQQREGRWVIVDLIGKRRKVRSVPMPAWVKAAIDAWVAAAHLTAGRVFRPVNRHGHLSGEEMTDQAIYNLVAEYADALGYGVAAHDLRRTFSKLAHKAGAPIEQIQLSLGHSSIQTTERYLGVDQDLTDAPGDRIRIHLSGSGS